MDDELKRLRAENAALRMRNEELQRNVDALLAELESKAEGFKHESEGKYGGGRQ